jgi:hypothetical protein
VCYLRTLEPGQGGGTKFHHPLLRGLCTRPVQGDAVVFFPAFEDGTLDDRMAHSGQPVAGAGAEKWIVNTWACQRPVPSAVAVEVGGEASGFRGVTRPGPQQEGVSVGAAAARAR